MTTGSDRILGMTTTGARRVLVASLVLNFLIIGGLFGLGLRGDPTPRPDGGAFGHITDLVAEDRREAVRAVMKERSKLRRAARRERTENWRDIADQIGAENFDADALGTMLSAYSDAHNDARKAAYAPLLRALSMMTPEERASVAAKTRAFADWRATRADR